MNQSVIILLLKNTTIHIKNKVQLSKSHLKGDEEFSNNVNIPNFGQHKGARERIENSQQSALMHEGALYSRGVHVSR